MEIICPTDPKKYKMLFYKNPYITDDQIHDLLKDKSTSEKITELCFLSKILGSYIIDSREGVGHGRSRSITDIWRLLYGYGFEVSFKDLIDGINLSYTKGGFCSFVRKYVLTPYYYGKLIAGVDSCTYEWFLAKNKDKLFNLHKKQNYVSFTEFFSDGQRLLYGDLIDEDIYSYEDTESSSENYLVESGKYIKLYRNKINQLKSLGIEFIGNL